MVAKRMLDVVVGVFLFVVMIGASLALLVLNPIFNRGPLFFVQTRMGIDCRPFRAIKFRSMTCTSKISRGANDPLETHRITRLGRILRKSRLDELPQVLNVFKGQMSLIGPRPDFYDHAVVFAETIPGYRQRHAVKPGISGFAQTEIGYAEGVEATRAKVAADLHYISNYGMRMEMFVFWRTLHTVLGWGGK